MAGNHRYDPLYGLQGQEAAARPTRDERLGTAGKWAPTRPPGTGGFAGYRSFSRWTFAPYAVAFSVVFGIFALGWPFFVLHGPARWIAGSLWVVLIGGLACWITYGVTKAAPVRAARREAAARAAETPGG